MVLRVPAEAGAYAYQKSYTRESVNEALNPDYKPTDWTAPGYAGPMFLYIFYGFYDAVWQACIYWYMGALSNSGRRLANYVGFYKGIQSVGAAIMASLDGRKVSFMSEFISNWALLGASLVVAAHFDLFCVVQIGRTIFFFFFSKSRQIKPKPAVAPAQSHLPPP